MPVNNTLASYSDVAFATAFGLYAVALLVLIAFYVRVKSATEDRAELGAREQELVAVGAGSAAPPAPDHGAPDPVKVEKREALAAKLAAVGEILVYVGVAVHLASVVLRGLSASRFPWGNLYEYIAMFTLVAMAVAAVALRRDEMRVFWPWLLVPIMALMFYGGTELYAESAPVVPALQSIWFPIHVSTVIVGASIFLLSGVASLLYVLRMWQKPGTETGVVGAVVRPLPSAKALDTMAYRTAIWAFPLFSLGVVFGAIWAESAWGRFWGWDPKETVSFVTWLVYAAYLHARATSGWRSRGAAWINIVGFATMVFNLFFINMVVSGLHSYAGLN